MSQKLKKNEIVESLSTFPFNCYHQFAKLWKHSHWLFEEAHTRLITFYWLTFQQVAFSRTYGRIHEHPGRVLSCPIIHSGRVFPAKCGISRYPLGVVSLGYFGATRYTHFHPQNSSFLEQCEDHFSVDIHVSTTEMVETTCSLSDQASPQLNRKSSTVNLRSLAELHG